MSDVLTERKREIEQELIVMLIGGDDSESVQMRKKHILRHVTVEMFDDMLSQNIVKAAQRLGEKGHPITLDYFLTKAKQTKTLLLIEEAATVQQLNNEYVTSANCGYYIKLLQEMYFDKNFSKSASYEEFKHLEELKKKVELKNSVSHISDDALQLTADYFTNFETAVMSGYASLDKRIGAFLPGDFIILAGAPGMGKTCFLLNLAMQIGKKGKKVLIFSLEMPKKQLQNRIIAANTKVHSSKMRTFTMTDNDIQRFAHYSDCDDFKSMNIYINDDFDMTVADIQGVIQKEAPDLVFIDYLGLVTSSVKGTEYEQLNQISRDLKKIAKHVPIVAVHQLSRMKEERKDKTPFLGDLRGSGHLEQNADSVIFVHRPFYYDTSLNPRLMQIIIAKGRHTGGNKRFSMDYEEKIQKITDPCGETPPIQKTLKLEEAEK